MRFSQCRMVTVGVIVCTFYDTLNHCINCMTWMCDYLLVSVLGFVRRLETRPHMLLFMDVLTQFVLELRITLLETLSMLS